MSKRSRAFAGCSLTIGPRSASVARVAMSCNTRNGRSRVSSATVGSYDDVILFDLHDQSPAPERVERTLCLGGCGREDDGEIGGRYASELAHRIPGAALLLSQCADDANTIFLLDD